jgi:hypothetical protein
MSEFLAEAQVLIRPDTTKFRAELLAELEAQTKGIIIPIKVAPASTAIRETRRVTAATEQATVATQRKAAVDAVATKQQVDLTNAQRLGTVAAEKLAAVEQADLLAVTQVAGAKARLRAAEAAVTAARKASSAALAVQNSELEANVAATLASAEAEVVAARAAAAEAVAHAKSSKEIATHAAAEHALAKGAGATGLSLLGARGATLAASSAFLAGAAAVTILEKSIHEASAEQESAIRTEKVFGESAHQVEKDARGMAEGFGVSTAAALNFESKLGNLITSAGGTQEQAAELSQTLVKLAADEAAFQNVPIADVLRAIQLGLVGNSRGLRQYQIELNQARVNQVALRLSGKDNVKQLDQLDKIQARYTLLLKQTSNVQGTAADRAGNLAQEEKQVGAELANLGATIGRVAIPKVRELVSELGFLAKTLNEVGGLGEKLGTKVGGSQFGHFLGDIQTLFGPNAGVESRIKVLKEGFRTLFPKDSNRGFKDLEFQGEKFSGTLEELHQKAAQLFQQKEIDNFAIAIGKAADDALRLARNAANISFKRAISEVDRLDEKLIDVKIAGGGPGQERSVLEAQAAAERRAVAAADLSASLTEGRRGHDTAVKRRREAKQRLLDTLGQIRSINKDEADAAKKAAQDIADAVQAAADFVKQKLAEARQALLDSFALEQSQAQLQQTRAERTQSLVDDLAALIGLRDVLQKEIKVAKQAGLDAQTILDLELKLAETNNQIAATRAEQAKNRQQRKQAAFDRAATSIDLDIELAQTNKNIRAEIRARQARIRLDQERLKAVHGDTIAAKRLRNDIAAQRKAIKDLRGEADKRRKDLQAMEFEFLQTQSGFAATLLSNLLPTTALAGTVGGGAISTATPVPPADFARAAHQRPLGESVSSTQQSRANPRGASQSQMATLIQINRGILVALQHLVGQRTHPEAVKERVRDAVSMDFF